ncbi:MAG: carboxypeptidase-like regulatory domain-containing protein [Cryomorphaceae bacterium]
MQDLQKVNLSQLRACDQYWTDMTPLGEKRLCEKCEKQVTDFRKMSSREIALAHALSETAVCGLYSPDQLSMTTARTIKKSLIPVASFVSLLSLLSPNQVNGQHTELKTQVEQTQVTQTSNQKENRSSLVPSTAQQDSIIISGKATYLSEDGSAEPIPFANIFVKGTEIGTTTDFDGNYFLDISVVPDSLDEITLVFSYIGMTRKEMVVPNQAAIDVNFDTVPHDNMIAYSVTVEKVPFHKRVWRGMISVFR